MNTTSRLNGFLGNIALVLGLVSLVGLSLGRAQEMATPVQSGSTSLAKANVDWNSASDLQVMLQAVEMMPTVSAESVPMSGTFYSAQHSPGSPEPWPPLPGNLNGLAVWNLGDGVYLLDDHLVDYSMPLMSSSIVGGRMMAADGMAPPGGGGGGDGGGEFYSDSFNFNPDYGTNLWIANFALTPGDATGIISNTFADIEYELQYTTDLTQPWQSANWFFYGSELTNWTPFNVPSVSPYQFVFARALLAGRRKRIADLVAVGVFRDNGR